VGDETLPHQSSKSIPGRIVRGSLTLALWLFMLVLTLWASVAISFSNLPGDLFKTGAAWVFGISSILFVVWNWRQRRKRAILGFFGAFFTVLIWWLFIPASHDRDWMVPVAVLPHVEIEGDRVTVYNVRNFHHRSVDDFDVRYDDRTYDLNQIEGVDMAFSNWGVEGVVHALLSFGFSDGSYLCVSSETRKEKHETDVPLALYGLFKQFELIFILGDERDLLRLRTNYRKETVHLYPTQLDREKTRKLFLLVMERVNDIHRRPEWYNTIEHNCLTSLVPLFRKVTEIRSSFLQLLFAGDMDKAEYDRGTWDTDLPFEEFRELHRINQYVEDREDPAGYSQQIRSWRKR
jgi:Domain of unknown function (DUF4105)